MLTHWIQEKRTEPSEESTEVSQGEAPSTSIQAPPSFDFSNVVAPANRRSVPPPKSVSVPKSADPPPYSGAVPMSAKVDKDHDDEEDNNDLLRRFQALSNRK
jgi:hypothetical protein